MILASIFSSLILVLGWVVLCCLMFSYFLDDLKSELQWTMELGRWTMPRNGGLLGRSAPVRSEIRRFQSKPDDAAGTGQHPLARRRRTVARLRYICFQGKETTP